MGFAVWVAEESGELGSHKIWLSLDGWELGNLAAEFCHESKPQLKAVKHFVSISDGMLLDLLLRFWEHLCH